MKRSALLLLVGLVPMGLGLGFWSCSGQTEVAGGSHGIDTPLDVKEALSREREAKGLPRRIDIRDVSAFLDEPRFGLALEAYWDSDFEQATTELEKALGAELQQEKLNAETWFQLGHLRARAEQQVAAAEAFTAAAEAGGLLAPYARYLAARARLEAGQPKAALALLADVPEGLACSRPSGLLRAELLLGAGQVEEGIASLRRYLAAEGRPEGWERAALRLAAALVDQGKDQKDSPEAIEALGLAREVALALVGSDAAKEALLIEQTVLAGLSAEAFKRVYALSGEQQLIRLEGLVNTRKYDEALVASQELLDATANASDVACEAQLLKAKAVAGKRQWGKAVDLLEQPRRQCKGEDLRARLHFVAGKFAQIDKRYSAAIRIFADLETEAPSHRLADDARIRRAQSYLELGDEARFTELLGSIVEDYPEGDVALDGLFELAMRQVERGDWAKAANVLERGIARAAADDMRRDHEFAGRERYFRARAWMALGQREQGLAEYETLIRERPFAYYMLHAFSRLWREDKERATAAMLDAIKVTEQQPFLFEHRPEFDTETFQRALLLARHGELDWAERELKVLEALDQPELLWSIAMLYGRAGAASRAHQLARGKLTDWLQHYPVGDWKQAWELAFPRPFLPIVNKLATKHDVAESLVYAVMREESAFRPAVVSHADAYGLMQLIKPTAKHFATKQGLPYTEAALKRPSVNIALGVAVLENYSTYFPDDPLLAIPGYNAGPGRPRRWRKDRAGVDFDVWVELIPFNETRRYTKRVLASRGAYSFLYYSQEPEELLLPTRLSSN